MEASVPGAGADARAATAPAAPTATAAALPGRSDVPVLGLVAAGALWLVVVLLSDGRGPIATAQEALCYWLVDLADPYGRAAWTRPEAYVYSPVFAQLIAPLLLLPWPIFVGLWTGLLLGALAFLTGPQRLLLGVGIAAMEIAGGNIALLLAVAVVVGFRYPVAWSFVLLTKVTPGIGLLWFAVRREWRALGIALAATVGVAALSALAMPEAWVGWFTLLASNVDTPATWAAVPIPLTVRLPLAAAVVVWGARTDRRWTVPVAAMLALPALWYGSLAMLVAVVPLTTETDRRRVRRRAMRAGASLIGRIRHRASGEGTAPAA